MRRGGRERQLATIVSNTNQKDYPTNICYLNKAEPNYIDDYHLNGCSLKIQSKTFFGRLYELHVKLKDLKPKIVYTWGNLESFFILLLKPFHNFLFINGSIRHGIRSRQFSHYFRTLILNLSPNVVSNSYAGLNANNLKRGEVLYNGIDEQFVNRLKGFEKRAKRKKMLNDLTEKPVLISVANFVPYKDYVTVLTALKDLKNKGFEFLYVALGDGPLLKNIEELVVSFGLEENVRLPGNVQNVNDYLQVADIFVHSSKGEGCSNAILEAMATGLPVVATNTGGTPEIVTSDVGFLYPYRKVDKLAGVLEHLLKTPDIVEKKGKQAHEKIKEKFTIGEMMSNYYTIIDALVQKNLNK